DRPREAEARAETTIAWFRPLAMSMCRVARHLLTCYACRRDQAAGFRLSACRHRAMLPFFTEPILRPELDALSSRLRRLSSTVVSDVLDRAGFPHQSLSAAIRPLASGMKFAGAAACFSGVTVYGESSGVKTLSPFEIDRAGADGVVIVIA